MRTTTAAALLALGGVALAASRPAPKPYRRRERGPHKRVVILGAGFGGLLGHGRGTFRRRRPQPPPQAQRRLFD